jgi:hypothetical protein
MHEREFSREMVETRGDEGDILYKLSVVLTSSLVKLDKLPDSISTRLSQETLDEIASYKKISINLREAFDELGKEF